MSNETIPPNLFKANLELQLRLQRLMQENGQQWLENAARAGKDGIAESGAEIESLLKAENWQELATLPAQTFWRQFQHHVGGAQALTQVAIKNQTSFTQGLQKAIQDWQKSVTQAVGQGDAVLPFQDMFKQWGAVWASAQDKEAPGKTGGPTIGTWTRAWTRGCTPSLWSFRPTSSATCWRGDRLPCSSMSTPPA